MTHHQTILTVRTPGRGFTEITDPVARWVAGCGVETGLLTVFLRHTSAGLVIQENADPTVLEDLTAALDRLAPEAPGLYRHSDEGADDMPAHIRSLLTGVSLSIPVVAGRLALGTWQGICLAEHRRSPHQRQVVLHLIG